MTRNTKEIALIQHRSGNLAEMPKALHQAEIGLAKDANRLFIGNAVNTILANRNEFPYQNLEILTEYSELKNYFKYSYENNITSVDGVLDRSLYKEFLPIVIYCEKKNPTISATGDLKINGITISFTANDDITAITNKINAETDQTKVYASVLPTSDAPIITIISMESSISVEDVGESGICRDIGFPTSVTYDIRMPERNVTEKLDDMLNISDFDVRGDGTTNVSQKVFNALVEIYKNNTDSQFFRNVMFPAGTYIFEPSDIGNIQISCPFPIISNMHVHGEGIDRTIIKSTNTDANITLLAPIDSKLNTESSGNYGQGEYPSNIVIEDMTFDSTSSIVTNLSSVSNITFNRVKFVGTSTSVLVEIFGTETNYANNITFNECIFEGGTNGIEIPEFAKNITINNCKFINLTRQAIKAGEESDLSVVYGINADNNIFTNCAYGNTGETNNYVITLDKNVQYSSIHQSIFDKEVIERTGVILPYKDYEDTDRKNFCDTLDITTDTQKILKFNFAQPQWEYLDYLVNQNGKKVLIVDGNDSDITADNGLNITENAQGINIKSVKDGNVTLSLDNNADIIVGEGTDTEEPNSGNIQVKKTIKLNDNIISNDTGFDDITIQTSPEKVIAVDETGATPYEQLVLGKDDAIPNVAYVDSVATQSYIKSISFDTLPDTLDNTYMPLISFDKEIFGNNVHIKRISINVRTPFGKVFEYLDTCPTYQVTGVTEADYWYYKGDVVKDGNTSERYGVVTKTHKADGTAMTPNPNVQVVPYNTSLKSVKYVGLFGVDEDLGVYNLTQTYSEDFSSLTTSKIENVDISATNKFGYDGTTPFTPGMTVTEPTMVDYQDRNYVILKNAPKETQYNPEDLHNTGLVARKYTEGNNYIFEMDRNYTFDVTMDNISSINFAGGSLKLRFYDTDNELITEFTDKGQLNPGGELIIRVDYIRNEV